MTNEALIKCIMSVMECAFDPHYGEAWNERQVADALSMPHTRAIVVDRSGGPLESGDPASCVGFLMSRHAADEEELLLIAVRPEHRGNNIGRLLIENLFSAAKTRGVNRVFLEMRRDNPAVTLYLSAGFEPIGQRPDYYKMANGDRIDAITFAKTI